MTRKLCFLLVLSCSCTFGIGAAAAADTPAASQGGPVATTTHASAAAQSNPLTSAACSPAASRDGRGIPDLENLNLLALDVKAADGVGDLNLEAAMCSQTKTRPGGGCSFSCKSLRVGRLLCVSCCSCCDAGGVVQCDCASDCVEE